MIGLEETARSVAREKNEPVNRESLRKRTFQGSHQEGKIVITIIKTQVVLPIAKERRRRGCGRRALTSHAVS